jgi:hypothetical protein
LIFNNPVEHKQNISKNTTFLEYIPNLACFAWLHWGRQPGFPGYSAVAERLAQLVCGGS